MCPAFVASPQLRAFSHARRQVVTIAKVGAALLDVLEDAIDAAWIAQVVTQNG